MTTTQQPEALVFADDRPTSTSDDLYQWAIDAEDLIRTQHARIAELEEQLAAIGARRWSRCASRHLPPTWLMSAMRLISGCASSLRRSA